MVNGQWLIVINIYKGKSANIKDIKIFGNKKFKSKILKNLFFTKNKSYLSFLKQDNIFSKLKLNIDLNNLKNFYIKKGFLDFKIKSCVISLSKKYNNIFISIKIEEGNLFKFGKILLNLQTPDKINNIYIKKFLIPLKSNSFFFY